MHECGPRFLSASASARRPPSPLQSRLTFSHPSLVPSSRIFEVATPKQESKAKFALDGYIEIYLGLQRFLAPCPYSYATVTCISEGNHPYNCRRKGRSCSSCGFESSTDTG